jgi:RNA polymerase sigma-70 factor, ECF subfamily
VRFGTIHGQAIGVGVIMNASLNPWEVVASPCGPSDLAEQTDELLIEGYRSSGDTALFEIVVRRYERELYVFLKRFLGDSQKAEDAFQATFITIYQRLDQFESGRRFRPWLYAIATNKAIDFKRQAKRQALLSLDASWSGDNNSSAASTMACKVVSKEQDPAETALESEVREEVREMIGKLNAPTQLLIQMAFYEGMKYADISEALGIPIGTVKSRVFNAMRKLSQFWKRKIDDAAVHFRE